MRANAFNTGIASEYLVLSKLYRLELEAYISQGNRKGIDIRVIREDDIPISIDVKSVRAYSSLVINNVEPKQNHIIVFVIYNNKFNDLKKEPEIFIVPSLEIEKITENYGDEKRVLKKNLIRYKDKWDYILYSNKEKSGEGGWILDKEEEQWIDFVNCHGDIKKGKSISETLKKYNIEPHVFLQLQEKLPKNQYIKRSIFEKHILETYTIPELKDLLKSIQKQKEKDLAEKFGIKIEKEIKKRVKLLKKKL